LIKLPAYIECGAKIMMKQNMNRILIVDDEPDITLIFEKGSRDKGFEQADTVNDPLLALKKLIVI
jgi:hypothetical protein